MDMCINQEEVLKGDYKEIKNVLNKSYDSFKQDLYAAEIIELGNIYCPPVSINATSIQCKNAFNQSIERNLIALAEKIKQHEPKAAIDGHCKLDANKTH